MSDIIQLLPDSVANQIAAGEVIQRPASVVKELVENAVDADATHIQVIIVDAGRTLIQVIDDGKGMSDTDARLSFERHATSKIRSAGDLFNLTTMGFRGEALASIAAVAQIELKTRLHTDELGTSLTIAGSKVISQEPIACAAGSNFSVENLFFNVPARRKFLKSNTTELNNILTAFERIALVYPKIHFSLHSNGVEMFNLSSGSLRQRIVDVFGKKLNQDLLPIETDTTLGKIYGFVGKPESAKKKGAHQYFFVNGRYMKHPYFHKAVQLAFDRLVPEGEQVPYFIYMEVPAGDIDVNIHPTKTEIKFENEQTLWQIISASVKEAIGMFHDVPSIDFDTEGKPDIPVFREHHEDPQMPKVAYDPSYNPFKSSSPRKQSAATPRNWEKLYEGLAPDKQPDQGLFNDEYAEATEDLIAEKSPSHYQYKGQYIMTAVKSGLMIIDQHRAHVRILYDSYVNRQGNINSQKVLFPEVVQFPPSEQVVVDRIMPDMQRLGFELSSLGGGSYAVNGIPSGLEGVNTTELIHRMVADAVDLGTVESTEVSHLIADCLARHAAIPVGQVLSNEEMEEIVNGLFACSNVNYTPDGKPILCILKQTEIEGLFG